MTLAVTENHCNSVIRTIFRPETMATLSYEQPKTIINMATWLKNTTITIVTLIQRKNKGNMNLQEHFSAWKTMAGLFQKTFQLSHTNNCRFGKMAAMLLEQDQPNVKGTDHPKNKNEN